MSSPLTAVNNFYIKDDMAANENARSENYGQAEILDKGVIYGFPVNSSRTKNMDMKAITSNADVVKIVAF